MTGTGIAGKAPEGRQLQAPVGRYAVGLARSSGQTARQQHGKRCGRQCGRQQWAGTNRQVVVS